MTGKPFGLVNVIAEIRSLSRQVIYAVDILVHVVAI